MKLLLDTHAFLWFLAGDIMLSKKTKTLIGHTGNAYGLLSAMFFCQNRNFGVVLLTNGSRPKEGGENRILEDIVSAMYEIFN